jgi:hypothetical protein
MAAALIILLPSTIYQLRPFGHGHRFTFLLFPTVDVAGGGLRIYGEHSNKTNVESIAKQRTQHFPTYVNTYSIWREEIQNRNRLLDLAGRNNRLLDYLSGGEEGGIDDIDGRWTMAMRQAIHRHHNIGRLRARVPETLQ